VKANAQAYADEVVLVLRPGGRRLYATYRRPRFLEARLQRPDRCDVQVDTLEGARGMFE